MQQNASPPNVWLVSLSQHVVCAQLFPIADMYAGDSTIEATADAYDALTRMGINIPQGAEPKDWTGRKIGGFRYVQPYASSVLNFGLHTTMRFRLIAQNRSIFIGN